MIDEESIKVMENFVAKCFCSLRVCQVMRVIIEHQALKMPTQGFSNNIWQVQVGTSIDKPDSMLRATRVAKRKKEKSER